MATSSFCVSHAPDFQQRFAARRLRLIPNATLKSNESSNGVEQGRSRLEGLLRAQGDAQLVATSRKCSCCGSKGHVECTTCKGSGLYIDSILESQGIIVQVNCLGCGGCGKILCPQCWGRN